MIYLINPKGKRVGMARRKKRRKLAGAALAAHQKKHGTNPHRKRRKARRGAARRHVARGTNMSRKRVRRHRRRSNPVVRHHRRRRHNPFSMGGGIIKTTLQGVKDTGGILLGEFGTNTIAGFIPMTGALAPVAKVVSAIGTGLVVTKFLGARLGEFALAGGLATIVRPIVKGLNIPVLSAGLGDVGSLYVTGMGAGAYPQLAAGAMAAYPQMQGMGDVGDLDVAYAGSGGNY